AHTATPAWQQPTGGSPSLRRALDEGTDTALSPTSEAPGTRQAQAHTATPARQQPTGGNPSLLHALDEGTDTALSPTSEAPGTRQAQAHTATPAWQQPTGGSPSLRRALDEGTDTALSPASEAPGTRQAQAHTATPARQQPTGGNPSLLHALDEGTDTALSPASEAPDARRAQAHTTAPAWQRLTSDSPLLLHALAEDADTTPSLTSEIPGARRARRLGGAGGPAPVPGPAFAAAVRRLLGRLGPEALRSAGVLAALGPSATPSRVGALIVRLAGDARGVAVLDAVGLTEAGRYRCEAARDVVLAETPPSERAAAHREIARFLYEDGADPAEVSHHLVAAGPVPEDWATRTLREAAGQALRANDGQRAVRCLRTAYEACAPDGRVRAAVRAELAQAEWEMDPATARRHLDALLRAHHDGHLPARCGVDLAGHLLWHGRPADAEDVLRDLDAAAADLPEDCRDRLETVRVWYARAYPVPGGRHHGLSAYGEAGRVGAIDAQADGATLLRALLADRPEDGTVEAAERLLQGVVLHRPPVAPAVAALASFVQAGRLDRAAAWCELLYREARGRTPTVRALFAAACAAVHCRVGDPDLGRRRADEALTLVRPDAWGVAVGVPLAAKALACTAQGDTEAAAECFRVAVPEAMFRSLPALHYLQARGCHHLSVGRHHAALGDFHACRDLMAAWRLDLPSYVSWRVPAAEALIGLNRPEEAGELLDAELSRPRPGNTWLHARARELRARLPTASRPRAQATAEDLSAAERRVAELAALGRTNREIADALFVTRSTVEQHLTRVYRKLAVRGRAELAAALGAGEPGR
ncbi:LuxR C-terminal-related transcriptional regulator, partial [Streptomyces gamaensis]